MRSLNCKSDQPSPTGAAQLAEPCDASASVTARSRIAVIGLGNELVSDDGAGIHAARMIRQRLLAECGSRLPDRVAILELSTGGFPLLDSISSFERVILIDAMVTGSHPPGTVTRSVQIPGDGTIAPVSSHQLDLPQLLGLARLLGAPLPASITVYGIESQDVTTFAEHCTRAVADALPPLAATVCDDVLRLIHWHKPEKL